MFDARYFVFATTSALLVISPGATMAVVLETAIENGRAAAFATVAGVNIGNSTLALASALGMAVAFARWPSALHLVQAAGACYLTWLGARSLWRAIRNAQGPGASAGFTTCSAGPQARVGGAEAPPYVGCETSAKHQVLRTEHEAQSSHPASSTRSHSSFVARGIATNLLNPPVILFYMTFLPQFISHEDPFFARFLVLAATHISMSLVWLSIYAISIGTLSERMARPGVRRWMAGITGAVLIGLGIRLVLR
jgi:threonine/homoserine/homoserine lactone efflux protein